MKRLIHRSLNLLGYRLVKIEAPPPVQETNLRPLFSALIAGGFAPRCIVDVGANRGIWSRAAIKFFPRATFVMVEPQQSLQHYSADLLANNPQVTWITAGVADTPGILPLHRARREDSCSFLPGWAPAPAGGASTVNVEVTTLNHIAKTHCPGVPDIVKIDAEGLDLQVIDGASELLGKTDLFFVEAAVLARGPNTLAEVVRKMAAAGYRLVDMTDVNRSPNHGITWLCELAFLRNGCTWLNGLDSYD